MALQIDDEFNNVLDTVLDDIDGLLMSHLPPDGGFNTNGIGQQHNMPLFGNMQNMNINFNDNNNNNINGGEQQQQQQQWKEDENMVYNINNNNNNYIQSSSSSYREISQFKGCSVKIVEFVADKMVENEISFQLKDYIFISKDCTQRLSEYIVKEEWGKQYGLLYKYIDYIFRCQTFSKQIIEINDKYLVFHSGLQRKRDKEFLYVLLIHNKKYDKNEETQKWRVQYGHITNSFLSKQELLNKFNESYVINDYLPKRTKFHESLSDLLYDETYQIDINWKERIIINKDRIRKILGNVAFFNKTELSESFENALNETQRMAQSNPRLAVAQGFVDTKHCKYRMELLLPLNVEFPINSGNYYLFALALSKSTKTNIKNKYIGKSILTTDMAYNNARLIGYVDSNWLQYGISSNNNNNHNK